MTITIQQQGRRYYLTGDTYPHRDAIRALGAHWDASSRAWWTAKKDDAEALVARLVKSDSRPAATDRGADRTGEGDATIVAGKATYKGKTYYLVGRTIRGRTSWDDRVQAVETRDGSRLMLSFRDGSRTFWAAAAELSAVSHYERPKTIGSLRAYAERLRRSSDTPELDAARRRGWDGKIGSPSYYSSGAFDEIDQ